MNNMPEVSVIIPTYNRAHLVGRAIKSVLNQTYQDFELIVVDDSSTDNTEEVVKSFNDKRIRYIKHNENRGGSAVRNTGIKASKGIYIAFLDDDDELLPQKLECQLNKFQKVSDKVGAIYSGYCVIFEKNGRIVSEREVVPTLNGYIHNDFLKGCITPSHTLLIKKICFQEAGLFDETLPGHQDWDMWIRISKYYEFDFVPDILCKYYLHGNQLVSDLKARITAKKKMIRKHFIEFSNQPSIFSFHLSRLGVLYWLAGNLRRGRKCFLSSIWQKPLQKTSYIYLLLSLLVPRFFTKKLREYSAKNVEGITLYF